MQPHKSMHPTGLLQWVCFTSLLLGFVFDLEGRQGLFEMRIYHRDLSSGCFRTVSTFTCTLNWATFIAWLGYLVGWLSLTHYTIMGGELIRWLKNVWLCYEGRRYTPLSACECWTFSELTNCITDKTLNTRQTRRHTGMTTITAKAASLAALLSLWHLHVGSFSLFCHPFLLLLHNLYN